VAITMLFSNPTRFYSCNTRQTIAVPLIRRFPGRTYRSTALMRKAR
jgi:hypothetical protein